MTDNHSEPVLYGDECPGIRGNTRAPQFGEWLRGVWASASNPIRDGMYVRTVRRTGRLNPGTWYELTDGKGKFWQFESKSTVYLEFRAAASIGAKGNADGCTCATSGPDYCERHAP